MIEKSILLNYEVFIITTTHTTKLVVRGKSKTGSKSYAIPITQWEMGVLNIDDPNNQTIVVTKNDQNQLIISKIKETN